MCARQSCAARARICSSTATIQADIYAGLCARIGETTRHIHHTISRAPRFRSAAAENQDDGRYTQHDNKLRTKPWRSRSPRQSVWALPTSCRPAPPAASARALLRFSPLRALCASRSALHIALSKNTRIQSILKTKNYCHVCLTIMCCAR